MAKDTGIITAIAVLAFGGFAVMYLTKNFCYGGIFPVDGLCWEGSFEEYGPDNIGGGGAEDYVPSYVGPITRSPTAADACNKWGGVWKANQCNCNRIIKKCAPGQAAGELNGKCACGRPVGGAVVTGGSSCSGRSGNCNWDCKNAYCWTSTGPKVNKVCIQGNSDRKGSCSYARQKFINANALASGSGSTGGGASGSGGGSASVGGLTGVQINNGKLFIASAIYTYVKACTGRGISTTEIVRGYPSAITQMAQMNGYHQTKIMAYNHRPFAHLFWAVVTAIMRAYKLTTNPSCSQRTACMNSHSLKECGVL